jgi:tripartite-type tricarboxylate transporter receptor subunit TctC
LRRVVEAAALLKILRFFWLSLATLAFAAPVRAETMASFYQRHPIVLVVFAEPGSTYDAYARLLASRFGDHMPGKPSIIVENMRGAGGLKAVDYLYRIAPRDGSVIGTIGRGLAFEPLLGGTDLRFDPSKFVWLGSMNRDVSVALSWRGASVQSLADLRKRPLLVPGTGAGADSQIIPLAINNLVGTKFKIIDGYASTAAGALAMQQGELDGIGYWSWSSLMTSHLGWIRDKTIHLLFQTGVTAPPELAGVPAIRAQAKTVVDRKALSLLLSREIMGRPFLAPPGVPADRAAALRAAFVATMQDPAFLADAKRARADVELVGPQEVDGLLETAVTSPRMVIERLKWALGRS